MVRSSECDEQPLKACSTKDQWEFKQGEECPFVAYINFPDLFGAEQLAPLYIMKEVFRDAKIAKRRLLKIDESHKQDPQINEVLEKGYCLQVFSSR